MAKVAVKMYSEISKLYIPHLSPCKKYISVPKLLKSKCIWESSVRQMYVRKSNRMLALAYDLILNFSRKKKTAQQIVFAQGSAPKFQVMPTQRGLVK